MRSPEANINPSCHSFEAVLSGMTASGQFDHMRIILSKNVNRELEQTYLMVTPTGFGVVKLLDIDYGENHICMTLLDICTGMIRTIQQDINDPAFSFVLISIEDIREMLMPDCNTKQVSDDLLEFEF